MRILSGTILAAAVACGAFAGNKAYLKGTGPGNCSKKSTLSTLLHG